MAIDSQQVHDAYTATTDELRPVAVAKQHGAGKFTARERVALLCGENFAEFGALVTPDFMGGSEDGGVRGDGVVTGTGIVDGRPVAVAAFDFTVLGGSNGTVGMLKIERCIRASLDDRIPLILMCDGGGHRIQEGLDSRLAAFGSPMLTRLVELSGLVPTVAMMMGPGFGLATTLAALCDFVVMVRGTSTLGMSAAPFVKAGTGEELTNEEIGGADVQTGNGVAHLATDDELEAIDAVRLYLSYLPSSVGDEIPQGSGLTPDIDVSALMPQSPRRSYDMRSIIEAICDRESMFEVQPDYACNIVTAFARIDRRSVGVVANQPLHLGGALDSDACEKAAHFVAVCDAFGVPLVILIDLPGFLIGSKAESAQLARRSGRLMYELGQATVPRFVVVARKAYGAAYIAMGGGRSIDADLVVAWPTAEISAMPIESAVDIAYSRKIDAADDPIAYRDAVVHDLQAAVHPLRAVSGFGIDDVITADQTRSVLLNALRRSWRRRERLKSSKCRSISPM